MPATMKLSSITDKTKLITDFVKQLAKTSKQSVPIVEVQKVTRVSGSSARPVLMTLEEGQQVKIYIRLIDDQYDIFSIDVNGKMQPLSGDYDNSYKPSFNASVDLIANQIRSNQKQFADKQAKKSKSLKAPSNRKPPMNKTQQRNALLEQADELDKVIATKQDEKTRLEAKLEQVKAGNLPIAEEA